MSPLQGWYDEGISRSFDCIEFFELQSLLRQNDIDVLAFRVEFWLVFIQVKEKILET